MLKKIIEFLKKGFVRFYDNKYRIVVAALVLALLLNIVHYAFNKSTASVRMSLNYSQAAEGLNPNSTRFSIYEFTCDEVLEKTIEYAGIEDKITPDELKECIGIYPADTSNVNNTEKYVCTAYNIYFKDKENIRGISSMDLLKIYCTAYKEYFIANYGDNSAVLYHNDTDFFSDEPYLKLSAIELQAKQIQRYVEQRINENTSYTDEDTGNNFLAIMKEISQVLDYDIPNIYGFIRESGIAVNKPVLVSTLGYKNKISGLDYNTKMAFYESDNYGIGLYDEAMSGIVLIPSVDVDDKYYMSRTETALDTMADNANVSLGGANEVQKEIANTSHTIYQMNTVPETAENQDKAFALLAQLETRIDDISGKLKALDTSYVRYKTHNYLTFKYDINSFLENIDISRTLAEVVIFLIGCYIAYLFFPNWLKKKRRKKESAHEESDTNEERGINTETDGEEDKTEAAEEIENTEQAENVTESEQEDAAKQENAEAAEQEEGIAKDRYRKTPLPEFEDGDSVEQELSEERKRRKAAIQRRAMERRRTISQASADRQERRWRD